MWKSDPPKAQSILHNPHQDREANYRPTARPGLLPPCTPGKAAPTPGPAPCPVRAGFARQGERLLPAPLHASQDPHPELCIQETNFEIPSGMQLIWEQAECSCSGRERQGSKPGLPPTG